MTARVIARSFRVSSARWRDVMALTLALERCVDFNYRLDAYETGPYSRRNYPRPAEGEARIAQAAAKILREINRLTCEHLAYDLVAAKRARAQDDARCDP